LACCRCLTKTKWHLVCKYSLPYSLQNPTANGKQGPVPEEMSQTWCPIVSKEKTTKYTPLALVDQPSLANKYFLKVCWHAATLFCLFFLLYTFLHKFYTFIRCICCAPLYLPRCCPLSGVPPMGSRALNRTRGRLTAARRRCCLSYAAPQFKIGGALNFKKPAATLI
jgi:hypothetical protein